MNTKDIIEFRNSIKDFSIEELKVKRAELQDGISKMILDSDLTMKIAIIEAQLEERGN